MVRNTASMQSLRNDMAGCNISSAPDERDFDAFDPSSNGFYPQPPMYGMTPNMSHCPPPPPLPQSSMPWPAPELAVPRVRIAPPSDASFGPLPLSLASNPLEGVPANLPSFTQDHNIPQRPSYTQASGFSSFGHDYQYHLWLLEQENKRSLKLQNLAKQRYKIRKRRSALVQIEKEKLGKGTPSSTWPRDRSPLLAKPLEEYTAMDCDEIDVLWQAYLDQQDPLESEVPSVVNDQRQRIRLPTRANAAKYTKPFCDFLTENPTVFHAVSAIKEQLKSAGWTELSERDGWEIKPSGKYFVERNGSSMVAFSVGPEYKPGNGAVILAGHVDALTAKLKPISHVPNKAGYLQLGVAPYAGAPNTTWWDRDLGIGGRVLIKEGGKIVTKLVKLGWPIARIPTLAPHFGAPANGPFNPETQMVPIIGLDGTDARRDLDVSSEPFSQPPLLGGAVGPANSFISTQPPKLVRAIAKELGLGVSMESQIVNWELELFDTQPATVGGLDKEFIFAGRIDDKLCSWAAIQALIESQDTGSDDSSIIKVVGLFDDEEIGSLLRQGARGNFLPQALERAVGSLAGDKVTSDLMGRTYANSFLVSSDVTHAVNPNFLDSYLANHSPHLNVGVVVSADSNGHMTTDSVSTALFKRCADTVGAKLQVFQIRNDSRSGGTVGPMLSSMTGMRAIDAGIPQLSMHSIRATTGSLDPGLGVLMFIGFLNGFESVDREFRE